MAGLAGLALGAWMAWQFGLWIGFALFSASYFWLGPVLLFVAGFVIGKGLVGGLVSRVKLGGGGFWAGSFGRRIIGLTADAVLQLASIYIAYLLCQALNVWDRIGQFFEPSEYGEQVWLFVIAIMLVSMPLDMAAPWVKVAIGKGSRPIRRAWRSLFVGVGGSSRFAGLLEEWANPWKPGKIALGNSLYDPKWRVGKPDDRHFITIATSRSGKGRSSIVPNLLTWPGSALVIDPKGENAAITAPHRGPGQTVRIIDPFNVLGDLGLHKERREWEVNPYPVFRFNPLAEVDLNSLNVVEQIREITEAMVVPSSKTNPFFDDASKKIISGVIAHVLSSPNIKDEDRHLGTVRDYMVKANNRDLKEMIGNTAIGGLAAAAAMALKTASTGGGGDVMLTVQVHTEWLDSLAMRHALSASEFSLKELKEKLTTIYLVLPGDYIDMHARFLRLFVNLTLRAAGKGKKSEHSILCVLDEFNALGSLPILASAAGLIAGFGVKLWPICQNLGQIKDRYPDTWEAFLGNAGMWQVFAVNDQTTARYMSERLGHHISWRKVRGPTGNDEWEPGGATWLRTSVELARESSRGSGSQLVFCEGEDTFLLRRTPYDETFPPSAYSPNPYEREVKGWRRLWLEIKTGDKDRKSTDEAVERFMDRSGVTGWLERWDERARQKRLARQGAAKTASPPRSAAAAASIRAQPAPAVPLGPSLPDALERSLAVWRAHRERENRIMGFTVAMRREGEESMQAFERSFRAKEAARLAGGDAVLSQPVPESLSLPVDVEAAIAEAVARKVKAAKESGLTGEALREAIDLIEEEEIRSRALVLAKLAATGAVDFELLGSLVHKSGNGIDQEAQQVPTVATAEQGQGDDMTAWPEVAELPPAQKPKRARRKATRGV